MTDISEPAQGQVHTAAIAALEVVPFAMLIANSDGQALAVNQRWQELSGMGQRSSLGSGWLSVLDADARSRLRGDARRVAIEGGGATSDYQLGGQALGRWTRWWISRHELDGLALIAIAVADVHEDHTRQANLYHLATHDSLTGLINRSHFVECTDQALRRNERQARHVGVVFVDLDGFKQVNDQGGHSLGDRVLYAIGARLRHAVRSADLVARIGGDEFAVLCEGLSAAEQAEVVARRISIALAESVELDGESWAVAASVGTAVDHGPPDSAEDLLDRADRAMYAMKSTRREPEGTAPPASEAMGEPEPAGEPEEAGEPVSAGQPEPAGEPAPAAPLASPDPAEPQPLGEATAPGGEPAAAADTAAAARQNLLSDMLALRDSLDAIRERLGRLAGGESGVIDIREKQDAGNRD